MDSFQVDRVLQVARPIQHGFGAKHHAILLTGFWSQWSDGGPSLTLIEMDRKGLSVSYHEEYPDGYFVVQESQDPALSAQRWRAYLECPGPYRLGSNNCEHFASYIVTGQKISKQVNATLFFGMCLLAWLSLRAR